MVAAPLLANNHPDDCGVALMLLVQRDDPNAFSELLERFSPLVKARFVRLLHDRQEAEDLTQEVFLRLYRFRKRYRVTARFTTWLFHISQNVARNALRGRRRRPQLQSGFTREDRSGAHIESEDAQRDEVDGIVRAAVQSLRGKQRQALEMLQFQNRSYAEIAAALGLSAKATKSLLYRARLQLREALEKRRPSLL